MAWSCFSVDGETWVARQQQGTPAERAFGGFVVLALLWSGVPLVIAATLASSRGESIGTAIVLTLFLGWIWSSTTCSSSGSGSATCAVQRNG